MKIKHINKKYINLNPNDPHGITAKDIYYDNNNTIKDKIDNIGGGSQLPSIIDKTRLNLDPTNPGGLTGDDIYFDATSTISDRIRSLLSPPPPPPPPNNTFIFSVPSQYATIQQAIDAAVATPPVPNTNTIYSIEVGPITFNNTIPINIPYINNNNVLFEIRGTAPVIKNITAVTFGSYDPTSLYGYVSVTLDDISDLATRDYVTIYDTDDNTDDKLIKVIEGVWPITNINTTTKVVTLQYVSYKQFPTGISTSISGKLAKHNTVIKTTNCTGINISNNTLISNIFVLLNSNITAAGISNIGNNNTTLFLTDHVACSGSARMAWKGIDISNSLNNCVIENAIVSASTFSYGINLYDSKGAVIRNSTIVTNCTYYYNIYVYKSSIECYNSKIVSCNGRFNGIKCDNYGKITVNSNDNLCYLHNNRDTGTYLINNSEGAIYKLCSKYNSNYGCYVSTTSNLSITDAYNVLNNGINDFYAISNSNIICSTRYSTATASPAWNTIGNTNSLISG